MIRDRIIKINDMIKKIKDDDVLKEIFNLVKAELKTDAHCRYTLNDNGVFFDLKLLSDKTLIIIEDILKNNIITETESVTFTTYNSEDMI